MDTKSYDPHFFLQEVDKLNYSSSLVVGVIVYVSFNLIYEEYSGVYKTCSDMFLWPSRGYPETKRLVIGRLDQ